MSKTKDGLGLVLRAAQFAAQKHKEQRRKDVKGTPYINHPIDVAEVLRTNGGVHDSVLIAAALLHDTIEDTETTYEEVRGVFGAAVADVVVEVTDVKFLTRESRKRLQVARAGRASERARQLKIADKICNLRDILARPPAGWSTARKQAYFDWAKQVVEQARGVNPKLERMFDRIHRQRPVA